MRQELTLYIGNKNYSSWSFRPWIAMRAADIPFEEVLIPFDFPAQNPKFKALSPSGLVPLLQHDEVKVWESLAIIEYVAELFPEKAIWPEDRVARAQARSVCTEMVSGFRALRNTCPMNFRRERRKVSLSPEAMKDIARIQAIWMEMQETWGGPFLFGAFSAADAMFAPVVNRFDVYDIDVAPQVRLYMERMMAHPAWLQWREAALQESWVVAEDEA